jgi:hypothetical protein
MKRESGASLRTIDTVAEENPLRSATSRIVTTSERRLREARGSRAVLSAEVEVFRDFELEAMRVPRFQFVREKVPKALRNASAKSI